MTSSILKLTPVEDFPLISPGDDLVEITLAALRNSNIRLNDHDILVLAQKIVSKAEGRLVDLNMIEDPAIKSVVYAAEADKDPRLVELIMRESNELIRIRPGLIIVEHRLGFICANAGIDHSNVAPPPDAKNQNQEDWVLLLPQNPDASAAAFRKEIESKLGVQIGVLIIDSHGRAWRNGIVGVTIGISGVPGIVDKRGEIDLFGSELRATEISAADELAAAASLMMGQVAEGTPVIHVRGFPYQLRESSLNEILRPKENDLFR
jgi:coenzyme F420-0:L-glutamate ligase/coenzyme F420-1:gamma-L-glutamate ligase